MYIYIIFLYYSHIFQSCFIFTGSFLKFLYYPHSFIIIHVAEFGWDIRPGRLCINNSNLPCSLD